MFEISVFSNPVNALVGEGGLLKFGELGRAAIYDEELVKPALLLADLVHLQSHRVDLVLDQRRDVENLNRYVPLFAQLVHMSENPDPRLLKSLGLTRSALLTEAELREFHHKNEIIVKRVEGRRDKIWPTDREAYRLAKEQERSEAAASDDPEFWDGLWERAAPLRQALLERHMTRAEELSSTALAKIAEAGLLVEMPWDRLPKSRPRQVIDNLTGPNAGFQRAFESMIDEVSRSRESVMLDSEVQTSLLKFASPIAGLESASVVGGAVDLMRMVEGLSELPLDEIPDLRAELEPYTAPFRTFMLEVSSATETLGVDDAERARLLAIAWETKVEPAIREMHAHVERASFVRNAIDVFATGAEATRTVGLAVGIAAVAGFTGFSTLSVAAAAAPPLLKAFIGSIRAKQDVRRGRAYFVHALDKSKVLQKLRRGSKD